MRAVGVGYHREVLTVGHEFIDKPLETLLVDIVVARPVNDEEISLEL